MNNNTISKFYHAKRKNGDYEIEYKVRAESKEDAEKKIYAMCGERIAVHEIK